VTLREPGGGRAFHLERRQVHSKIFRKPKRGIVHAQNEGIRDKLSVASLGNCDAGGSVTIHRLARREIREGDAAAVSHREARLKIFTSHSSREVSSTSRNLQFGVPVWVLSKEVWSKREETSRDRERERERERAFAR